MGGSRRQGPRPRHGWLQDPFRLLWQDCQGRQQPRRCERSRQRVRWQLQAGAARWPMGLGKYLMDKLEVSMLSKGVLQVDKIGGKKGNFVYINGRSVGLSNKLNDFASLAAKMSVYEAVLAKLTAKLPTTTKKQKTLKVLPPQWQGN